MQKEYNFAYYWTRLVEMKGEYWIASQQTFIMVGIASLVGVIFGLVFGIILRLTSKGQMWENLYINRILGMIVDFLRAYPFVILMIAISGFSRIIVGTSIGPYAAAVPLSIAAIPFFARLVEQSLREVPKGVVEAAQAMGTSDTRIIFRVLLTEVRSGLVLAITTLIISILGYSAAAGILGAGGLGDLAMRYGHYRGQKDVIHIVVVMLSILVLVIQTSGNVLAKKLDKR